MNVGIDARWCFRSAINTQFLLFDNLLIENMKQPYDATFFLYTQDESVRREDIRAANVVVRLLGESRPRKDLRESNFWRDFRWFGKRIPDAIHKDKIDIFLSPYYRAPRSTTVPVVNMVHDLSFAVLPSEHLGPHLRSQGKRLLMLISVWLFCKYAATHTLTVSEYSKSLVLKLIGLHREKVFVTYNAIDIELMKRAEHAHSEGCRNGSLPEKYLLYVGYNSPKKNLVNLLLAYRALPTALRTQYPLVLRSTPGPEEEVVCNSELEEFVHYLPDYLSREELASTLAGAYALALVSYDEGFGLPVVEALAAGVPVIISGGGSLSEITEGQMTEVDPDDVTSISSGIVRVLNASHTQRLEWKDKGREIASKFAAKQVADYLMSTVRHCVSGMRQN